MTANAVRARLVANKKTRTALPLWTHIMSYPDDDLNVDELVKMYGVHRSTVYRWRRILLDAGFLTLENGRLRAWGNEDKPAQKFSEHNPSRRLARALLTQRRRHDAGFMRYDGEKVVAEWANLLLRFKIKQGRAWPEIEKAINFSQENKFWRTNIVNVKKLIHHFDALMMGALTSIPKEATERVYAI